MLDHKQLRLEVAKLRELQNYVDSIAMPRLVALLREHATITENMADNIETMVGRMRAVQSAARSVAGNVTVLARTRERV